MNAYPDNTVNDKPSHNQGFVRDVRWMLQAVLDKTGLSAAGLGLRLRLHPNRMYAILRGERHITPDTALRLERLTGTPRAEDWLVIQAIGGLAAAREKLGDTIRQEVTPLAPRHH